jgi:hypothetical protein
METELTGSASKSFLLDAWEKHENIAMHFNDLILRIRIQALGALTAVVTVGGVFLKPTTPEQHLPWGLLTCVLGVLLLFWIAIWLLDFRYYNRLLLGSIDSLLALESAINNEGKNIEFNMSHKIEDAVLGRAPTHRQPNTLWGPVLFYSIVTIVLGAGAIYSCTKFLCSA